MDSTVNKLSPAAQTLQHGLALANRKMLETAAALGRNLILGDLDGGYTERPAAQLLDEARKSTWWHENFEDEKRDDSIKEPIST